MLVYLSPGYRENFPLYGRVAITIKIVNFFDIILVPGQYYNYISIVSV